VKTVAEAVSAHRRRMEEFRWELPDPFNFGRDVVDRIAPERPALLWRDAEAGRARLRFGDVARQSDRVARLLRTRGIAPGDPVLILLPRIPAWHVALVGALKAGALVIPGSTILRPKDIAFRVAHSGARLLLTGR
jgi:acyl-coenzyme A synthetase/AMP-(fatty) acid ligase